MARTLDAGDRVCVIGGGWAGCAAAVTLAQAGTRVAIYEAAAVLGGRARGLVRDGLALDNGEHLLLGAYVETRRLAALVHGGASRVPWTQAPLAMAPLAPSRQQAITLRARSLPAPFGLLFGLLAARGFTWRERLATIRWFAALKQRGFRCPPDATVSELLSDLSPRVADRLWAPLCLAALNTPAERASGQVFANVLRAAFDETADGADMLRPTQDLSELFPAAAARWLATQGQSVYVRASVTVTATSSDAIILRNREREWRTPAVIVAVGPHQLAHAFDAAAQGADPRIAALLADVGGLAYEPITTIYVGYRGAFALPPGLVRLDDEPGQWLLDRPDIVTRAGAGAPQLDRLFAVIISAQGPHNALAHPVLAAMCDAQLRRLLPSLPPLAWSFVIEEKRATYACTPTRARPSGPRLVPGVYLAGDYINPEFPATLEAAVRSGIAAAEAMLSDRSVE